MTKNQFLALLILILISVVAGYGYLGIAKGKLIAVQDQIISVNKELIRSTSAISGTNRNKSALEDLKSRAETVASCCYNKDEISKIYDEISKAAKSNNVKIGDFTFPPEQLLALSEKPSHEKLPKIIGQMEIKIEAIGSFKPLVDFLEELEWMTFCEKLNAVKIYRSDDIKDGIKCEAKFIANIY